MFLGQPLGLQRYDSPKYPVFEELTVRQQDFFWRASDQGLAKDRGDHARMLDAERAVFDANLRFQIAGDSMLSRSIGAMIGHCTNSALEACLQTWAFFETIHSRSYTTILDNAYPDATGFYDSVFETPAIVDRISAMKARFDDLLASDGADVRRNLFNAVLAAQIMEGVTFYTSFACSFYFASRGQMTGNGNVIKLISRDENQHVAITHGILKYWRDRPEEGFQDLYREAADGGLFEEAFRMAVDAEKDWAEYLFSQGSLVGLTAAGLGQYAEWIANNRLASLRRPRLFGVRDNPFSGWIDKYYDSTKTQVALQEEEGTSYLKGTEGDIGDGAFAGFSFGS